MAKAELFGAGDFFPVFAQHIHPTRTSRHRPGDGRREQILPGIFPEAVGEGIDLAAGGAVRPRTGQSDRAAVSSPRAEPDVEIHPALASSSRSSWGHNISGIIGIRAAAVPAATVAEPPVAKWSMKKASGDRPSAIWAIAWAPASLRQPSRW